MSKTPAEILADDELLTKATQEVFGAVDSDQSGQIDAAELKTAFNEFAEAAGIPPFTDEKVAGILQKLDTDGSGTLNVTEFKELIRNLLQSLVD